MPKLDQDVFERQMTETLKVKGVKKLTDLVQHYKTISDALDENGRPISYAQARNMTLRFKKRDGDFTDLKKMWNQFEQQGAEEEAVTQKPVEVEKELPASKPEAVVEEVQEIQSDKDLALVLMAMVQEAFFNPQTGFWIEFDAKFDRAQFTKFGKDGWQTPGNDAARQEINRLKNEQVAKIMSNDFVKTLVPQVHETLLTRVFGVKKRDVKHAVKNHVRFHMYDLIYKK